ncbi:MAG: HPr family phosphocarrier protein [Sphingomonadaceae bacterium]
MATAGPVTLAISNRRGLHARASTRLVATASRSDTTINVAKDGREMLGTSIMGLMMLAAAQGDSIEVRAEGPQAEAALAALVELVETRFGED